MLNVWSADVDKTGSHSFRVKARLLSAPGLLVYVLVYTFYTIDFAMSLELHWMSSIFALLMMVGGTLSTLSILVILMWQFSTTEPLSKVLVRGRFHDIGNLMLAFTMLWAYVNLSQFLIIWSANLPEEIPWYLRRFQGGWEWLILAVVVLHFALPYALLLSQDVKRHASRLRAVAAWILVMRAVDLFWLVAPDSSGHGAHGLHVHWMDVAAWAGLGGLFLFLYALQLKSRPLLPVGEPQIREAMAGAQGGAAALAGGHA